MTSAALTASEMHSCFLQLDSCQLEATRCKEKQKFQNHIPTSMEELFFLRAVQDLKSMREEYENGMRSLSSIKLPELTSGLTDQVLSHMLAGHKQHIFVEKYVEMALEKSLRTAVKYVKWLEQDNVSWVDNLDEVLNRFEAVYTGRHQGHKEVLLAANEEAVVGGGASESSALAGVSMQDMMFADIELNQEVNGSRQSLSADLPESDKRASDTGQQRGQKSRFKRHSCPFCGKVFIKKSHYTVHVRIHTKEKPFSCDECGKSFNYKGTLVQHMVIHSNKRFPCLVCDMTLKTRQQLVKHMWRVHQLKIKQEDLKNKECTTCRKRFYTEEELHIHGLCHTDGFKCDACPKTFKTYYFLEHHLKSHEESKGVTLSYNYDLKSLMNNDSLNDNCDELDDGTEKSEQRDTERLSSKTMTVPSKQSTGSSNASKASDDPRLPNQIGDKDILSESDEVGHDENAQDDATVNSDGQQFQCLLCEKNYSSRSKLNEHMRSHSREKPFQCEICLKSLSSKFSLKDHYALHANLTCSLCSKSFHSKPQLARHIKDEHEAPTDPQPMPPDPHPDLLSKIDEFQAGSTDGQTGGRKLPVRRKLYDCEFCGKILDQKWKYTEHVRTHTGEKPFTCDICSRSFAAKNTLKDHRETHSDVNHPCVYCGKVFNTSQQMKRHIRKRCNNSNSNVMGDASSFLGDDDDKMVETPQKCDICGRMFKSQRRLECHMRVHTEGKEFTCEVCGKAFNTNSGLNCHRKRAHEPAPDPMSGPVKSEAIGGGGKPAAAAAPPRDRMMYMCCDCGKRFTNKTKLRYHINIHTGERPFKCSVCAKSFRSATNLLIHNDVHLDKKFPCEYCGKMMNTRSCLYRHRKKQHKERLVVKASKDELDV